DKKYHFKQRIEAEETALEAASMVVTSTNQEVQDQYGIYDHYVPSRMEVIPPGTDLSAFTPPTSDWKRPKIADEIDRFLSEPNKPIILAMARPDERKNLSKLVEVYGQSEELRHLANLVLIMGTRDDIESLPKPQAAVIKQVLGRIDRYDLYGHVAYPKTHTPEDVCELYRHAALSRGVFVNAALTEPFGLTLLEAGATGLPLVATNDGGPRDIIGNCQNGLLVDPLDNEAIEHALLRVLTESDNWDLWSKNGIDGTRKHYSWSNHARRYLRDLDDILESHPAPTLRIEGKARRLPEFDRLIVTDLDNTLTGDQESLEQFCDLIRENDHIGFGIATGRHLDSARELIEELGLPQPDLLDTDSGTQLHYGPELYPDVSWRNQIGYAWEPRRIVEALDGMPGLERQVQAKQSEFKISYLLVGDKKPSVAPIKKCLRNAGLRAKVVISLDAYVDILPVRGGSELSMRHLLWKWGFTPEKVLVAGDSGNDAGMLLGRTLGVVVANHGRELNRLKKRPRIYFAQNPHAAGILEGIEYYNFLDHIRIPNDQVVS
ncbi:MAG: HAD-IIB family hydrolase, partial [Planctomycetota bacterium]